MPIQIPDFQQVEDPGTLAVRTSLGVAQQDMAALRGLGGSLGQVGSVLSGIGEQMARAKAVMKISEAELDVHEASSKFMQSLVGDYDEGSWVRRAKDLMGVLRKDKLSDPDLSRAAREEMEMKFNRMESGFLLKVGGQAATQIAERTKEAGLLALEMHVRNNDLDGYVTKVRELVDAGAISPEHGTSLEMEGKPKIRRNEARELTDADPIGLERSFEEDGPYSDLDTDTRLSLKREAKIKANGMRREFADSVGLSMERGEYPSVEQVEDWRKEGLVDDGTAASFIRAIKADPSKFDAKKFVELSGRIAQYSRKNDDEALTELTKLKEAVDLSGFTGGNLSRLRTRVQRHIDGVDTGSIPSRILREFNGVLKHYHDVGAFGLEKDVDGVIDPESEFESNNVRAELWDQIYEELENNPPKTQKEARERAGEIVSNYVDLDVASSILRSQGESGLPGLEDFSETPRPPTRENDGLELPQREETDAEIDQQMNEFFEGENKGVNIDPTLFGP